MEVFVRGWFHARPPKGEAFLEEIVKEQHRGLRELARIPLLLALLCLAFEDTLGFPSGRAGVYRDALDALLRQWDDSRLVRRDEVYRGLSLERKHQLLASIAAQTFKESAYFVPQQQLESMISRYLAALPGVDASDEAGIDAYAVLKAIEAQHGILVERAHRIYSFAHLSFQEYYTARYMVADQGSLPQLLVHCPDSHWSEVVLLAASLLDNADTFFDHFRRAIDTILMDDEKLVCFLRWVSAKSATVDADMQPAGLRGYYSVLALDVDLVIDFNRERDILRELDHDLACGGTLPRTRELAHKLALYLALGPSLLIPSDVHLDLTPYLSHNWDSEPNSDLAIAFARDLDLALARSRGLELALDFTLTEALVFARKLGRSPALTPAAFRPLVIDYVRKLGNAHLQALNLLQDLGIQKLHEALSGLDVPNTGSSEECLQAYIQTLQMLMIEHRNIGYDWKFSSEQARCLADYFGASYLLAECLDLANVSDRTTIEDTLFLPPGTWSLLS
jgi:hypothetical protein